MSVSLRAEIRRVITEAKKPLALAQIRAALPQVTSWPKQIPATLQQMAESGQLSRSGKRGHYAYQVLRQQVKRGPAPKGRKPKPATQSEIKAKIVMAALAEQARWLRPSDITMRCTLSSRDVSAGVAYAVHKGLIQSRLVDERKAHHVARNPRWYAVLGLPWDNPHLSAVGEHHVPWDVLFRLFPAPEVDTSPRLIPPPPGHNRRRHIVHEPLRGHA